MDFCVSGKVTFDIEFDIKANSEEEAIEQAKKAIIDYYHLNVNGAMHDPDYVKVDIDATEYED